MIILKKWVGVVIINRMGGMYEFVTFLCRLNPMATLKVACTV